ncbi:MAG: hypothetical protein ACFCUX_00235 [Candidatus Methylacidiphilales bacterium]
MNTPHSPQTPPPSDRTAPARTGFFKRLVDKLDQTMKEKAAKTSSCCGSGDDQNSGKCC